MNSINIKSILLRVLLCISSCVLLYIAFVDNKLQLKLFENFNLHLKKYSISIVCIFKNEQNYMEEWLDYHKAQGFDHIFMYCNDQDITKYPYLQNNKYTNFITITDWTNKKNNGSETIQRQAYGHCIQTYSHLTQFLLLLDLDEFVVPIKGYRKVSDYFNSLKNNWNNIKSFKIQRYDFGSSGHIHKPFGLVMSNYKFHEKICSSYKAMANTDFVKKDYFFFGVHDFNYINKRGIVYNSYLNYEEFGGYPNKCKTESVNEIPLVINHYYTKSYDEYLARCKMWSSGGINPVGHRKDCENLFKIRDVNDVEGY